MDGEGSPPGEPALEVLTPDLRRVLDVMPDDITIIGPSGVVLWASARAASRLGYEREEMVGTFGLDHVHPDDVELVSLALDVVIHEPDRVIPLTFRYRHRDGSTSLREVTGASVRLGDDDPVPAVVLSARDREASGAVELALQQVAAGASLDVTLQAMLGFVTNNVLGVRAAMKLGPELADGDDFFDGSCPRALLDPAAWPQGAPWDEAFRTGEQVELTDLGGCSPEVQRVARDLHLVSCLAAPVHRSGTRRPAVLVLWFESPVIHAIAPHWLARELVPVMQLMLEQHFWRRRLQHAARFDALTELANRPHVFEILERSLARCRGRDRVGVLYVDLDGFKPVNDRHGHAAGDAVLVEAARRFAAAVRPGDLVGRMGGDEFAVVCPGCDTLDEAVAVGERIVTAMREAVVVPPDQHRAGPGGGEGPVALPVGASVGVTIAGPGTTAEEALSRADHALYRAKAAGKDRVAVHPPSA